MRSDASHQPTRVTGVPPVWGLPATSRPSGTPRTSHFHRHRNGDVT
jgi:hypothetical protein